MKEDHQDLDESQERSTVSGEFAHAGKSGRLSITPRLTNLLIGGAALGLIVLMCLVVALLAVLQNS